MNSFVPISTSLSTVYPPDSVPHQQQRWEHLLCKFSETYGHAATFISRSPGRVNIIGEHIDYSLFSVLPMAVEADLLLACRITPDSSSITISNVLGDKFPQRTFVVPAKGDGDLEIDATKLEWSNYFKSGYRGTLEFLRRNGLPAADKPPGMQILVDGNVPSGGGLSSSAAFCVASALAAMVSMGVDSVDKKELVTLAIVAERYVGVNAGGMDQSASVLGEEGSACYISFDPELDAEPVAFPKTKPEPVFLIANTYKTVEKHVTAPVNYNLRVVECTLAAQVLAKKLGVGKLRKDAGPLGSSLKGLIDAYSTDKEKSLVEKYTEMLKIVEKELDTAYTREQLSEILQVSVNDLIKQYMTKFPVRAETFNLKSRALHVFGEAARVVKFMEILKSGDNSSDVLQCLGALMNESQQSCKELFNCSCEELDELCRLARGSGSYGSRLTGAGWGGCSVHLVPEDKAEEVKAVLLKEYYGKLELSDLELEEAIVVTKPGSGSVLFKVEGSDIAP
ncbi:Galactokinase [Ascodesmis nigricans]|uniref:Galactokinase n=1 Tax=Ascodesmis nigricans TaxID=341454 RepID=A0A4V3SJJ2_9PEZI|nr:Galactokinase [Ascodesmis nigricans]